MSNITDINTIDLALGFLVMVIPVSFFLYFKIKMVQSVLIALVRMAVQLSLIAFYLEWIFEQNNALYNSLWVFVMILVGIGTSIRRIGLN